MAVADEPVVLEAGEAFQLNGIWAGASLHVTSHFSSEPCALQLYVVGCRADGAVDLFFPVEDSITACVKRASHKAEGDDFEDVLLLDFEAIPEEVTVLSLVTISRDADLSLGNLASTEVQLLNGGGKPKALLRHEGIVEGDIAARLLCIFVPTDDGWQLVSLDCAWDELAKAELADAVSEFLKAEVLTGDALETADITAVSSLSIDAGDGPLSLVR
eukprot:PLAT11429.1.p2 GENE.PLAT11429.1~~PLAT11429.1.p2  ORF type:complete len:230 (-),score=70.26 PLAT11429.1:689-1336(-)